MKNLIAKLIDIWHDPVWSAVIAGVVLAAGAFVWRWLHRKRNGKPNLEVKLTVKVDPDSGHVALVEIQMRNPSRRRPVSVAALEFITKEYWEMPDPFRTGYTAPLVDYLPRM